MFCSLYVYLKAPPSFLKIKYAVKGGEKEEKIQLLKASRLYIHISLPF